MQIGKNKIRGITFSKMRLHGITKKKSPLKMKAGRHHCREFKVELLKHFECMER